MIEDYSYEGENFHEDPYLPLPKGEEWDDRGKKDTIHHVFNFLILSRFYFVTLRQVKKMAYADIGHIHPTKMPSIDMQAGIRDMVEYHSEVDEDLRDLEENL